jgi:hypothetical protein
VPTRFRTQELIVRVDRAKFVNTLLLFGIQLFVDVVVVVAAAAAAVTIHLPI